MSKINKIIQANTLAEQDTRWYSSIKNKIESLDQGYGTIEMVLKIKAEKVVAIEYIAKGSENIG